MAHTGALGQPVAHIDFGLAKRLGGGWNGVNLGGIEEVHTPRHAVVHDGVAGGFVHLLTKGHGAQADGGDVQIALTQANGGEVKCVHGAEFTWGGDATNATA